jgi:hypothetical protein
MARSEAEGAVAAAKDEAGRVVGIIGLGFRTRVWGFGHGFGDLDMGLGISAFMVSGFDAAMYLLLSYSNIDLDPLSSFDTSS